MDCARARQIVDSSNPRVAFEEVRVFFNCKDEKDISLWVFSREMLSASVKYLVMSWERDNFPVNFPASALYSAKLSTQHDSIFRLLKCPFRAAKFAMDVQKVQDCFFDLDVAEIKHAVRRFEPVSYTHLTLPTNREV